MRNPPNVFIRRTPAFSWCHTRLVAGHITSTPIWNAHVTINPAVTFRCHEVPLSVSLSGIAIKKNIVTISQSNELKIPGCLLQCLCLMRIDLGKFSYPIRSRNVECVSSASCIHLRKEISLRQNNFAVINSCLGIYMLQPTLLLILSWNVVNSALIPSPPFILSNITTHGYKGRARVLHTTRYPFPLSTINDFIKRVRTLQASGEVGKSV